MNRITKIAAAAALTSAIALPASQAFAASKTENALIGAAVGALAGSLLAHGSTEGVLAGAAVGGLVGVAADKPDRYRRGYTTSRARYESRPVYRNYREAEYRRPVYRDSYGYRDSYAYGSGYPVQSGYRYGY
jgi:uncharacterized protein YcfJ